MDILVIRFSSLGDVAMVSAVIEALHQGIPGANIYLLTKDMYSPLYNDDSRLSAVFGARKSDSLSGILKLLGRREFDAVIDLHRSLRSLMISSLLSSPIKSAVVKRSFERRLMIWSRNRYRRTFDVLGSYCDSLIPLGLKDRLFPRLSVSYAAQKKAVTLLADCKKPIIGISPGAKHATKMWNEESYACLADEIGRLGYMPVFIGDVGDKAVIERIRSMMGERSLSFAGAIDLSVTVALIAQFKLLVTNDSGPMHIAGALGTPLIAIFGPTNQSLGFVPGYAGGTVLHSGVSCSPCSVHGEKPCRMSRRFCMDDISCEMVLGEVKSAIEVDHHEKLRGADVSDY